MKYLIKGMIFFPLVFILACCGLSPSEDNPPAAADDFTVMVWNVQSLFDGEETGSEYAEFLETAGWTPEKYKARLTAISQAIGQVAEEVSGRRASPPDLLGLVEVENEGVLKDLAGSLSRYGYQWTVFANLPGSSLGAGILSRFPIKETKAHSITSGSDTAPRPVLEVRVEPHDRPLVFLLCHWKSKLGNDTEALRRSSARVVQRRLEEVRETEPGTPVIAMGDLNENYDEFYRLSGSTLSALLPDDPDAAVLALNFPKEYLVLSGGNPPRPLHFPEDTPVFYSPWKEGENEGSYYYKGDWETIDHFLLSDALFDGLAWDYAGFNVLDMEPFTSSKGTPNAYVPRQGRGLSDHLPLLLHLRYRE